MALLRYLQRRDSLPDPKGSLSFAIPAQAIARANQEVQAAAENIQVRERRKRGAYNRYSPRDRADIGRYASQHGVAAAARFFSRKLKRTVRETTVRSMKAAYAEETLRKRRGGPGGDVTVLPLQKRGRPVLLGSSVDMMVQKYLKKVRDGGGAVSAKIAIAAARGILMICTKTKLVEFGGYVQLNRHWAYALLKRMKFVQRKATTAKSKFTPVDYETLKKSFLADVVATVTMEEIPAELILNWDQTGIKIVPSSTWTMERKGANRVEMVGVNDKRQITAIFCGALTGDFLPVQLVYKGKTSRCHPHFQFPSGWHIAHSPKHWSTEETMLQYIEHIILPYVRQVRERLQLGDDKPAVAIMDNFKGQITEAVTSLLEANNVHVCLLPANTTDLLQPMDIAVNKPAKDFLRKEFQQWYSEHVMKQLEGQDISDIETAEIRPIDLGLPALKEIGAKWLVDMASYISDNPQFIVNGFMRAGITGALDAHYSGDQPDEGTVTGDIDESGHDDSDETEEEETDEEDDDEAVINLVSEEEEIDDEDEQESDEEDNVYADDNEAVIELESEEE